MNIATESNDYKNTADSDSTPSPDGISVPAVEIIVSVDEDVFTMTGGTEAERKIASEITVEYPGVIRAVRTIARNVATNFGVDFSGADRTQTAMHGEITVIARGNKLVVMLFYNKFKTVRAMGCRSDNDLIRSLENVGLEMYRTFRYALRSH